MNIDPATVTLVCTGLLGGFLWATRTLTRVEKALTPALAACTAALTRNTEASDRVAEELAKVKRYRVVGSPQIHGFGRVEPARQAAVRGIELAVVDAPVIE